MAFSKKQVLRLVKACVNNDRAAQEALYKFYRADMLRVCLTYLPDKELAKEAFNTGFLKVFQSIGSYDAEKGELGGWIRRIMINTSIDMVRRELKFDPVPITYVEENEFFIPPAVLEKLYADDILKSIHQLPPAAQAVFNLSVFEGFSHKEIGEQLDISEGTSRWHLSEAKRRLRHLLGPDAQGEKQERRAKA
jgi:RNA polymerase sigma factor (sigma-70 family)